MLSEYQEHLRHRVVKAGLNLEGTCTNPICKVFNQDVWVNKGFDKFFIEY